MCFSPKPNQTLWTVSFTFGPFFNIKTSCVNWGKPSFQCLVVNRCLVLIFTQLIYGLVCLSQRGRCNKGIWSSSRSCQYPLLAPDPKRPSYTRDTATLSHCHTAILSQHKVSHSDLHCHSVSHFNTATLKTLDKRLSFTGNTTTSVCHTGVHTITLCHSVSQWNTVTLSRDFLATETTLPHFVTFLSCSCSPISASGRHQMGAQSTFDAENQMNIKWLC